jgi:hypothetical protein
LAQTPSDSLGVQFGLLIKNQMGYVSSFTPNESDGDLYQVLLLKNQMGDASSFTPQKSDGGM